MVRRFMTLLKKLFNFIMAIDPICGMKIDEAKAEDKGLVVKGAKPVYFCSKDCMEKYLNQGHEPWYRSQTFGKVFPWVLAVVLLGGAIWAYLGDFMILYMGIFFILFSLMKMLDWPGFVKAFAQYDLIAKNVSFYGWLYPGIEFGLGVLYLTNTFITGAAWITVFIMSVGAIGVGKNLLSKDKVSCACLGTKINVPLTKVTFLEDIIMAAMALMVLFY